MRKLVTLQRVVRLDPIKGADRIELATVLGWQIIVKKGEFSVGDTCVFFEIDSILPNEPRYTFLGSTKLYNGKAGHRLASTKMRGAISQGLVLPLTLFPEDLGNIIGEDISEKLHVTKYDVSIRRTGRGLVTGQTKGKFPSFLRKTDQERIQNLPTYFDIHKDSLFEETLKLEGSSLSIFKIKIDLPWYKRILPKVGFNVKNSYFGVCSRNLEIKRGDKYSKTFDNTGTISTYKQSDFWEAAVKYNIEKELPVGYAIQGELIGPRIQSNHEQVDSLEYYVFDIWDIDEQQYLTPTDRHRFLSTHFTTLPHVPVVGIDVPIFKEVLGMADLLKRVEGESMNGGISEGRVYKHMTNPDITFKAISNKYLLRYES